MLTKSGGVDRYSTPPPNSKFVGGCDPPPPPCLAPMSFTTHIGQTTDLDIYMTAALLINITSQGTKAGGGGLGDWGVRNRPDFEGKNCNF